MGVEPLQDVPLLNLVLHWSVFLLSFVAMVIAGRIWWKYRKTGNSGMLFTWKLLFFGFIFYTISEYSDLYTPGLKASLGMHNYFTESAMLVATTFLFIAIKRLIHHTEYTERTTQG